MARKKIWRYTVKTNEQKLWDAEDMKGWRKAFEACVEDDAREEGSKKYVIMGKTGEVLAKNVVRPLPKPEEPETADPVLAQKREA